LAAPSDLSPQKFPHSGKLRLGSPARLDGHAPGRHFVYDAQLELSVERQREGARDGRGGHHQHVRRNALFDQALSLEHAEAVLFVHDS